MPGVCNCCGGLVIQLRGSSRELVVAVEDCRHLTTRLERALLAAGARVLRLPPELMAGARQSSRTRGKADPIDALAIARAALHRIAVTQTWLDGLGKGPLPAQTRHARHQDGALRALERRLARVVFQLLTTTPNPAAAALPQAVRHRSPRCA